MLVRQCDRCGNPLKKQPRWRLEPTSFTASDISSIYNEIDLCEDCYKKFEKFMNDGDKE